MSNDLITTIRARHAAAVSKAARLRAQLDTLEKECHDFETAIKVFEGLTEGSHNMAKPSSGANDGMTIPDLITKALADGPKSIADVTTKVTELSGKSIDANNIRSTAWRMWKANRIARTGDDYHLIGMTSQPDRDDFTDLLS